MMIRFMINFEIIFKILDPKSDYLCVTCLHKPRQEDNEKIKSVKLKASMSTHVFCN